MSEESRQEDIGAVAVVGMACRFPGAKNLSEYWELLRNGVEAVRHFSDEELAHLGEAMLSAPGFVKARGCVSDIDKFDADFFGLSPKEAGVMDPQQRFFLENAWSALEHAGYQPEGYDGLIGVFAGSDQSGYSFPLFLDPKVMETVGEMQINIGNEKDHLAPRTSYLMNLKGPSLPIQTACSTSLVCIHVACQSLIHFECDIALAGGVSIPVPEHSGYTYVEGGTMSPDGHCRAFDAAANGTAPGSGVGAVVLKRLEDAKADGDTIHAVILGSAINNDGSAKAGYTAPSIEGQKRVIMEAQALAEIEAADIGYIETHGTATTLGDPIEVEALRQAFGEQGQSSGEHCALGSVKTNLGHCNAAAGAAGFIKTVLCLKNKTLVPSLNFEKPNPKIDFERSPFWVNTEAKPWQADRRIAGVSSFGIGGTNAHVIVSEAPATSLSGSSRDVQVVTLSARTATALKQKQTELQAFLEANQELNIADIAFTANTGRKPLDCRTSLVVSDAADAARQLSHDLSMTDLAKREGRAAAVFMFPGQGSAYTNFGRELFATEPVFRDAITRCCDLLKGELGLDLKDYLFTEDEGKIADLKQPRLWQPALFVTEYALAQQWLAWGIKPQAMIGHSIGEYVAATMAGVFSLENALKLIAVRGAGTQELPEGAMLAVIGEESVVQPFIKEPVSLAAVNGPILRVLSGPKADIDAVESQLKADGANTVRLASTHAFHSSMMEPLMARLTQVVSGFELQAPQMPFISNLTGTWMTVEDACDPGYWANHLRSPVQFNQGIELLMEESNRIFLEVGPGDVLSKLVSRHPNCETAAIASLKPAHESSQIAFFDALGACWSQGVVPDWEAIYEAEDRQRLPLPTYPFERNTYWMTGDIEGLGASTPAESSGKTDSASWVYLPTWKRVPLLGVKGLIGALEPEETWLIFADSKGFCQRLATRLRELNQQVMLVVASDGFSWGDGHITMHPNMPGHYDSLMTQLATREIVPSRIVHAFGLGSAEDDALTQGFDSLIHMTRGLASLPFKMPGRLVVVSDGSQQVTGVDPLVPGRAAALGAGRVIPMEAPMLPTKCVDLGEGQATGLNIDTFIGEVIAPDYEEQVAFRAGFRWLPGYECFPWPEDAPQPSMESEGVYLITHGLQETGIVLARELYKQAKAKVVLLDRTFLPAEDAWEGWLAEQGPDDPVSRNIARVRTLKEEGIPVEVRSTNLADSGRLAETGAEIAESLGEIRGVFHLFTPPDAGLIQLKPADEPSRMLRSKMSEVQALATAFPKLDFLMLFAENPGEFGFGQVEQAGYYEYLVRVCSTLREAGQSAVTVEWGTRTWALEEDDQSTPAAVREQLANKRDMFGMTGEEMFTMVGRVLLYGAERAVVTTRHYDTVLVEHRMLALGGVMATANPEEASQAGGAHPRPDLKTPYREPQSEVERVLSDIWQDFFDIDQVGVDDNFFELGGHSLLAVQLLNRVNDTFAVKVNMNELFDAPSVAELAQILSAEDARDEDDVEDLDALLAEIEGLSQDEIQAALEAELD